MTESDAQAVYREYLAKRIDEHLPTPRELRYRKQISLNLVNFNAKTTSYKTSQDKKTSLEQFQDKSQPFITSKKSKPRTKQILTKSEVSH